MPFARRILSLFAAYTVALQLLLLPLGVAAGAALAGAHCAPEGTPQHQSDGCPCCAAGCGTLCQQHAVAAPLGAAINAPVRHSTAWRIDVAPDRTAVPLAHRQVRVRGPPLSGRA